MYGPRTAVARAVDVRAGEWPPLVLSFAVLMLSSAAYTVMETARDALLVTRLPRREFGLAYIAVAACAIPTSALMARLARRLDPRRGLCATLLASTGAAVLFFILPMERGAVVALYVVVGLVSSTVFPQFWALTGRLLTVAQSRRLLGPISSAAVLGGLVGASGAAAAVTTLSIRVLLVISAACFLVGAAVVMFVPVPETQPDRREPTSARPSERRRAFGSIDAFREEPFLVRVAVLVVFTTATALVIDYFFKWTVARTMSGAERGPFIARYYAVMNGVALVVQIFIGSAIVRRLGVATAMVVTPLFSVLGGAIALVAGAVALPALVLKATDGSLRSSINRLTTELGYLPVSPRGRERAKPFIDGALMRIAQAATAGLLLAMSSVHLLSFRTFSALVIALAIGWLLAAVAMRRPYLGQLRRSVGPDPSPRVASEPLDVGSAELLVQHLGSEDPFDVIGAMDSLARRGRDGFIPALVLRHGDVQVLSRALETFARTSRRDWYAPAARLLDHPAETIRIAAVRALATHGQLDLARLAVDSAPSVRGYVGVLAALADGPDDLADDPNVAALMRGDEATRLGVLAAIADAPPSPRVSSVLLALADGEPASALWSDLLARASVRHHELAMIPRLISRLHGRHGREPARVALASLGEPALEEVVKALDDPTRDRRLRVHLPRTLARFGTKWAADKLLDLVEHERDGLVRYKAIRALGRIVVEFPLKIDRVRVERCAYANLVTHIRLLGLRVAVGSPPANEQRQTGTHRLFAGLLDDKLRQSLERAFRLLKIAHRSEDIHRVYVAALSLDKGARANAGEFLDALLRRRDQQPLRELVRLVVDDLPPAERVKRAAELLAFDPPRTIEDAIRAALADADVQLATLAALHAVAVGGEDLEAAVETARDRRPSLATAARELFQAPLPAAGGARVPA